MCQTMRFIILSLFLAGVVGCSEEQFNQFFKVLDAVAPQLLVVQADPDNFPPEDHPLRDLQTGTVLDDPSFLTGSWGRFRARSSEDPETGAITEYEDFIVLEIDLANGTMIEHRLSQCTQGPNCDFGDNAQRVFRTEFTLDILSDNLLAVRSVPGSGRAGVIDSSGEVVADCGAFLLSGARENVQFRTLFTIQGDSLNTLDGGDGSTPDEIIAFNEDNDNLARLWVSVKPD